MVTRRQFGVLVAAGVALALPKVVNAVAVTEMDVTIRTPTASAMRTSCTPQPGPIHRPKAWKRLLELYKKGLT